MNEIEKALKHFTRMREIAFENGGTDAVKTYDVTIQALQEKLDREKSGNKPLTLKELKERDGKPVWVVVEGNKPHGGVVDCRPFAECVMTGKYERLGFAGYVKHFVAYDREPKEDV